MDKAAARDYLNKLFGDRKGHVAVAYKDKGASWQESQFAWPADKQKLISWATIHQDANIFVCPALRRDAHTRKKGDMVASKWLWADVDWQAVPATKRDAVRQRIADLGTYIVASGSGDNAHVYVELSRPITDPVEFAKLNTGLRDYLYADNKQADNSLLRLPGTQNWKTESGSTVAVRGGHGQPTTKSALMRHRAFQEARVIEDAVLSDWSFIEVEGLPRRIKAMVTMETDEAVARYGSRHKAVWAITGELHRRGLGTDEIHSLMDKFPPAMSKAADENGYEVHRDVDKRLQWDRAKEPDTNEDEDDDAGEVFEQVSPQDMMDSLIAEGVEKELLRRQIRKTADITEAERGWVGPPDDASWSLTDVLKTPPPPAQYLIGPPHGMKRGLAGKKHNVIITAQFKTGKTTFVMSTIAKSLCDNEPFLGTAPVSGQQTVGHWNCEMDADEMAVDYAIKAGIDNPDRLHIANLRGHRVNILTPTGRQWAIEWLTTRQVSVWTIDSLARLARMAGVSEKDNDEMFDLLMALDEIKVAAGVDVLFLITHTGREKHEVGQERARGATAIDDWCDARWIMTTDGDTRFLAVDGRGVGMESLSLNYDEETGRSTIGYLSRSASVASGWEQVALTLVNEMGEGRPLTERVLINKMIETAKGSGKKLGRVTAKQHIIDAAESGFIDRRKEPSEKGPAVWNHYMVSKPEGDRHRQATPRNVVVPPTSGVRRKSRRARDEYEE